MEWMFAKDPRMQKLEEEGPRFVFNLPNIYLDTVTRLDGPRDVSGLGAFLSMKVEMPIAMLYKATEIALTKGSHLPLNTP